ncbi:pyridoxamine 5'-phosphate oxidase family protein [Streptomyces sp. NPDC003952]
MFPLPRHSDLRRLETPTDIETIIGRPAPMVVLKELNALDEGCRTVLAHSPIAAFGYRDSDGTSRTTFVGGAPGFAHVLSPTRISFSPPGSSDPHGPVSLFFLLPGVGEILRVNGTTARRRRAQISVDVTQAWVHCAQAILRSSLWNPPTATLAPTHHAQGDGPLSGPGIADFLNAAPFLALSSWDAAGGSDTSPRGDRQAAVQILDDHTLAIADRRGNKRADTLHNLLQDNRLSLAALVPGRSGVLHISGHAAITNDPALLQTMALRGKPPHLALLVDVENAEIDRNDALVRSRLWTPDARSYRVRMPDLLAMGADHLAANTTSSDGAPPALLIKAISAIPGVNRLLRWAMDRAYRSGLRKEGYGNIQPGQGTHRGIRRR